MEYLKPPKKEKAKPKPLKKTPIKKKPYKIRNMTTGRKKLETAKTKTYACLNKSRQPYCCGCGTTGERLANSHRISQSDRQQISNPTNLDLFCHGCHSLYENGYLWQLDNGAEIMEWLQETDQQRFTAKAFKIRDRIIENNLNQLEMPEWLQIILKSISQELN